MLCAEGPCWICRRGRGFSAARSAKPRWAGRGWPTCAIVAQQGQQLPLHQIHAQVMHSHLGPKHLQHLFHETSRPWLTLATSSMSQRMQCSPGNDHRCGVLLASMQHATKQT